MKIAIFLAIVLHAGVMLFGGLFVNDRPKHQKGVIDGVEIFSPENQPSKLPVEAAPPSAPMVETMGVLPSTIGFDDRTPLPQAQPLLLGGLPTLDGGGDETFPGPLRVGQLGDPNAVGIGVSSGAVWVPGFIDQKPRALFQGTAAFPEEMRGKDVEGVVSVIFIVSADGRVVNQRVEFSSHAAFEKPALEAVKQWKFEPGTSGGQKVATRMRVTLRFQRS